MHDSPLAMLDAATVAKDDLIPYSLIFPGRKGYNYAAKYNPDHRQAQLLCPVCTTILQNLLSAHQKAAPIILLPIALQFFSYMLMLAESFKSVCKRMHLLSEQTMCDAANVVTTLPSFNCYKWIEVLFNTCTCLFNGVASADGTMPRALLQMKHTSSSVMTHDKVEHASPHILASLTPQRPQMQWLGTA